MTDLAALRALAAKATPGPWRLDSEGGDPDTTYAVIGSDDKDVLHFDDGRGPDFALIVAAVNALPALLAEIESLRDIPV